MERNCDAVFQKSAPAKGVIKRVTLEAAIADKMIAQLDQEQAEMAKGQAATVAQLKIDLTACEKQIDLLLDMRLNEQISEPEYVSKKYHLVNRKAELKGKLEEFEQNRLNRLEPAIRFVKEAKNATFLISEGNQEKNRDFLKKIGSNLKLADKSLAVTFNKPWNLLADFNSDSSNTSARMREIGQKSKWRRE